MRRDQVYDWLTIAAGVVVVVWMRRSGRAELERTLGRLDEWIDDRNFLADETRAAPQRAAVVTPQTR